MKEGPVRLSEFENEDNNHFLSSIDTPIRSDAFAIDDELKGKLLLIGIEEIFIF